MPAFVSPDDVRAYLAVDGTDGLYSDEALLANIETASSYLQRVTGRQFEIQNGVTKTFSTEGLGYMLLPDLRSVTEVTLNGAATTDYTLLPHGGSIYTALRLTYRVPWYRLEPNDMTITGDWGWDPLPAELLHATKVLAAWYTKRPDAVLTNTIQTGEGNVLDLSRLPPEVWMFKKEWNVRGPMVG